MLEIEASIDKFASSISNSFYIIIRQCHKYQLQFLLQNVKINGLKRLQEIRENIINMASIVYCDLINSSISTINVECWGRGCG